MAGHRVVPFSVNRRMAAASAAVCRRRNTVHTIAEVDVMEPRALLCEHRARSGERLSFTAYVVACPARTAAARPAPLVGLHDGEQPSGRGATR
jgi:hypothetical protein